MLFRILALYAIIVAVGAALGVAVFLATGGASQGWPVTVLETTRGWRVSSPQGLSQTAVALTPRHMAWSNGQCLETLDLSSGDVTVIARPGRVGAGATAAADADHLVWIRRVEQPPSGRVDLMAADFATGRVRTIDSGAAAVSPPYVSGQTAVWSVVLPRAGASEQPLQVVRRIDLTTGERSVLASGPEVVLVGYERGIAVWTSPTTNRSPGIAIVAQDGKRAAAQVEVLTRASGLALDGCQLAGDWVVWGVVRRSAKSDDKSTILARNLRTGQTRVLTRCTGIQGLVTDDAHAAWLRARPGRGSRPLPSTSHQPSRFVGQEDRAEAEDCRGRVRVPVLWLGSLVRPLGFAPHAADAIAPRHVLDPQHLRSSPDRVRSWLRQSR